MSATKGMVPQQIQIRSADKVDLDAINRVIEAAVMSWQLSERVRRLALPVYRYSAVDLAYLDAVVAEDRHGQLAGVATWERASGGDVPAGVDALLLHGIYVNPTCHRQGIGRRLFEAAELAVGQCSCDGLLVRAQTGACGFFRAMGMQPLELQSPGERYAHRFWKTADHHPGQGQPDPRASLIRQASRPA